METVIYSSIWRKGIEGTDFCRWYYAGRGREEYLEKLGGNGRPNICGNCHMIYSGLRLRKEIVERYDGGICVNSEDACSIVDAIKFLSEHPSKAEKMERNGRKAVEEEFNWNS